MKIFIFGLILAISSTAIASEDLDSSGVCRRPDLVINQTLQPVYYPDYGYTIFQGFVRNSSNQPVVDPFWITLTLPRYGTYEIQTSALKPKEGSWIRFAIPGNHSAPIAGHFVADASHVVLECNEDNNLKSFSYNSLELSSSFVEKSRSAAEVF